MKPVMRVCAAFLFVALLAVPAGTQTKKPEASPDQKALDAWKQADLLRSQGKFKEARRSYDAAADAWRTLNKNMFADVTSGMSELCSFMPLSGKKLKDGIYTGMARGYAGDITLEVLIKQGKIAALRFTKQKETRPLNTLDLMPQRIVKAQSPSVDAVTGATITSYATMCAARRAISQAVLPEPTTTTKKP